MPMKVKMEGLPAYTEPETKTVHKITVEDDPFDHNQEYGDLISAMGISVLPEKKVVVEKAGIPGVIGTIKTRREYLAMAVGASIVYPPEPSMTVKSNDGSEKLYIFRRVPSLDDLKIAAGVAKEIFPEAIKIRAMAIRRKIPNLPSVNAELYSCNTGILVICPKGNVPYTEARMRKAIMVSTLRALLTNISSEFDLDVKLVDETENIDTAKITSEGF